MDVPRVRAVAIVGSERRHRWVVAEVAASQGIDLVGVVREQKRSRPQGGSSSDDAVIASHLEERAAAEQRFFANAPDWGDLDGDLLSVEHGTSNDDRTADWVQAQRPDILVLFGCSIIREPLLAAFPERTINLHLGLSPYYRGAATNFWPLVNGEPECVGATVHLATLRVDGGPILLQVRPDLQPDDRGHDIGCRAIAAGASGLRSAIVEYVSGNRRGSPQQPGRRAYRNADFNADAVRAMRARLAAGMVTEYLADRTARDARFPIVE